MNIEAHLDAYKTQEEVCWLLAEMQNENREGIKIEELLKKKSSLETLKNEQTKNQKLKGTFNLELKTGKLASPKKLMLGLKSPDESYKVHSASNFKKNGKKQSSSNFGVEFIGEHDQKELSLSPMKKVKTQMNMLSLDYGKKLVSASPNSAHCTDFEDFSIKTFDDIRVSIMRKNELRKGTGKS